MSPLPQFNLIGGRVNLSALSHPNHCAVPPTSGDGVRMRLNQMRTLQKFAGPLEKKAFSFRSEGAT